MFLFYYFVGSLSLERYLERVCTYILGVNFAMDFKKRINISFFKFCERQLFWNSISDVVCYFLGLGFAIDFKKCTSVSFFIIFVGSGLLGTAF